MSDPFAPPTDPRVNYTESDWTLTSGLTGKRYPFDRSNRKDTLRRLLAEDTKQYSVLDHRLTSALGGRQPTAQEAAQHLQKGDLLKVDSRSLAEQVAQDGTSRSNVDKDDSDFGGNPIRRGADLGNDKLWSTPQRRAMRDKLLANADTKDAEQALAVEKEEARIVRENSVDYQTAYKDSSVSLFMQQSDSTSTEEEITILRERHEKLVAGTMTPDQYFQATYAEMDARETRSNE